jgi:hypothetical protein
VIDLGMVAGGGASGGAINNSGVVVGSTVGPDRSEESRFAFMWAPSKGIRRLGSGSIGEVLQYPARLPEHLARWLALLYQWTLACSRARYP